MKVPKFMLKLTPRGEAPTRSTENFMGAYTKKGIDELIDKRDVLKKESEALSSSAGKKWEEYSAVVKQLQSVCPHDEGMQRLVILQDDTCGRSMPSLINLKCNLCEKIVGSETENYGRR